MDEDYLDSLLNGTTDNSKKNTEFDRNVDVDSGIDLDMDDLGNISLEELDDFDGLDLGDLELDDIDFDDIDIMNLDVDGKAGTSNSVQEEDFNLDSLISESSDVSDISGSYNSDPEEEAILQTFSNGDDVFSDADNDLFEDLGMDAQSADNSELANMLDSAGELDELLGTAGTNQIAEDPNPSPAPMEELNNLMEEDNVGGSVPLDNNADTDSNIDGMDIDDLFSALGIEGEDSEQKDEYTKSEAELDDMFQAASMNLDDSLFDGIDDLGESDGKSDKKKKKRKGEDGEKTKKTLTEILFGEPDADDIEEEQLLLVKKEQKKIEKEEKKAKKEEKKAEKEAALAIKKENGRKAKQEKADKKKAEYEAELEAEKDQKQVPTPVVIVVFLVFALVGGLTYFGSDYFHYSEVIRKAADYFERQRYRLAYDEVSGVEVKQKDEELRDRIYTVMYVERLYESYDNNMKLGRADKALDALLRGLEKYDEHYEEAVELQIVDDIDSCKEKIIVALATTYNLSEKEAKEIMTLEGQDYLQALNSCCEGLVTGE